MSLVRVRALFLTPDGNPASGKVIFAPRPRLRNAVTGIFTASTEEFLLDPSGYLGSSAGVFIRSLDEPGMQPGGWYAVSLQLDDSEVQVGSLLVWEADAPTGIDLAARIQFEPGPEPPSEYVLWSVFQQHIQDRANTAHAAHVRPDGTTIVADPDGTLHAVSGTGDKHYVHDQSIPATIWTINHGLNKHPSITVVDSAGTVCWTRVEYPGLNTAIVRTSAPFSGQAYCN